ncbi:hypothetical protein NPIL_395121 [Nephila pilipes]|uniref:Uncharacterized protein n=1 Tax=Nephila pilipes TaxID=299642 RepID=A0A8X6Q129_NEPPI|nr:hypothetical protein NPIL_395121 [Nephila pilipes]
MDSDSESLLDQDMISSASSSRASTPTHHEDFHVSCKRKREIERELKTYTDSIDHCQVLIRNLERQGLVNHPIYSNLCVMIQGLMKQRELLTECLFFTFLGTAQPADSHSFQQNCIISPNYPSIIRLVHVSARDHGFGNGSQSSSPSDF